MRKLLLTLAAIYLGFIGLSLMLVPQQFGTGAVPPDATPQLLALLRLLGGPMLGIAVLNWLAREDDSPQLLALLRLLGGPMLGIAVLNWLAREDDSPAVIPVLVGNLVGFGLVAANDVWGVASGEARDVARYFLIVHLGFAIAFLLALQAARREGRSG